ncbi:BglG family transcription antiterminator [Streptococcus parauberis]|uniref:BglG family transcription antiterminator n=1 Tax=Streptococcus parauberis TaxID=1348 RepID=UPI000789AF01|nr:PTS sugar transporter subunit IIA [Streptococcus parauberis]KYP17684.1 Ascorbate-specific phosphotransferase enzyme IIA component [Streptococcus parauberis]KYP18662.1 Ascorbate-specific phosphotransferase enzyme IIA component [Streptococcus parauberis]KYP20064.1 Ascorbate-specific phosphotransferase enzyme IIA component [Streptococcus parauberis]KYP24410.1 Ascorbate-specific phosphotransferase enzyme IIA component [Streptococcus parauberis]KYP27395.1 Ascorbate-specific phosphotransferase en
MNQRSKEILHFIIERKRSSLLELSELHEVSERTIRNDLSTLNDYLRNLKFGSIIIKNRNVELELIVPKNKVISELNQFNVYEYKFSREERSLICLLILIASKSYVTLSQLSERLLASRSTIVNDVKSMRKLATKHKIKIISKANKGFTIDAKEEDLREFLFNIIGQENFSILEPIIFEKDKMTLLDFESLQKLVYDNDFTSELTEKELNQILKYSLISAYRNINGFKLNTKFQAIDNQTGFFTIYNLGNYSKFLTQNDLYFIYYNVFVQNIDPYLKTDINKETLRIQVTTMEFIGKISQDLEIEFKDDYLFYENFSAHLLRMIRKEKDYKDLLLDVSDIVSSNLKIKKAILKDLYIIENNLGRKATPVEIDYIIIHVYAAMERKKRIGANFRVAVLTEQKDTEVFFLESKLSSNFSFNLDIYSINDTIRGDYDLILTTTNIPNKNYLQISPFVSDEDYILIANHLNEIYREKDQSNFNLDKEVVQKLYKMIEKEIDSDYEDLLTLKKHIKLKLLEQVNANENEDEIFLHEFLTPERISLDIDVSDWKDSIYKAGQLLIDSKDISQQYLDIVIENIEQNGPYVVISEGFAFPHAEIGEYNFNTAMRLIRLKNPIYYSDSIMDDNDDITTLPVKYVCILSATEEQKHLKAIFNLFNLLKQNSFKVALDKCCTSEEVYELIKEKEHMM